MAMTSCASAAVMGAYQWSWPPSHSSPACRPSRLADSKNCRPSVFIRPAAFHRPADSCRRQFPVAQMAAEKNSSAEKVEWKVKRATLLKNGVKSFSAKEALSLSQEKGFTLVDVRPKYEFEEIHPAGAVNAEVYRLIKEWTAWDILRRAGFAFFGVFNGTEENPEFLSVIEGAGLKKDSKIITACAYGGTLKPTQNFTEGKESRSLIAAYILSTNGYTNVYHLEGGLSTWFKEDYPVNMKEDS